MNILQLCHKIPFPPLDGGAQAIFYTTIGLAKGNNNVKTLAINTPKDWIEDSDISVDFKSTCNFEYVKVDTRVKPLAAFFNLFSRKSYLVSRFYSKKLEDRIEAELKSFDYQIVQLEHLYLCLYIPVIRKVSKAKIVLRPQNVEYVIWKRYLKNVSNPFVKLWLKIAVKRLMTFEKTSVNQTDGIIAITKDDQIIFESFAKNLMMTTIPMGYDLTTLGVNESVNDSNKLNIYHLASMDWLPNLEAVDWFVDKVYPQLRGKLNNAHITLAGKHMPERFFQLKNPELEIQGAVLDPKNFQIDKQIMIVPLWSGSGIRAKIVEGMALGKVIVSTTIGAQGINAIDGEHIIIADDAKEFAEKIIELIGDSDLRSAISKKAKKFAQDNFDHSVIAHKMCDFYHTIL